MFRTYPGFEFKHPLTREIFGENSGIRHWNIFEYANSNYLFIVECLIEEGDDKNKSTHLQNYFCETPLHALQLIAEDDVLEHRLNLMIPAHATLNRQIHIKPIVEIFAGSNGTSETITSDGERYITSPHSGTDLDLDLELVDRRQCYSKANIDVFR